MRIQLAAAVALLGSTVALAEAPPPPATPEQQAEQRAEDERAKAMGLKEGPLVGEMGVASVKVAEGQVFTDGNGAKKWAQLTTNPISGKEIGLMGLKNGALVLFEFDDVGYVKDDEKNDLNADDLLKSIKEGTDNDNAERQKAGLPPLNILGWEQKPAYNEQAHALEWCVRAESGGTPSYNFNTRLLGRRGVVAVTLMFGGSNTLNDVLPEFRAALAGFSFKQGETYSEYKSGDKLAEYGLAALVAGGGVALAAKSGLLAKLGVLVAKGGKAIFLALAAAAGAVGKFFQRLFGKKKP
ncbi:MAG TPA: DUF2167 domain-containing protein [Myxococcota bacterium]|jgi:uncharacterized membrane-anchored protein